MLVAVTQLQPQFVTLLVMRNFYRHINDGQVILIEEKNGLFGLCCRGANTAGQETWKMNRNGSNTISVVISLLVVQFVVVLAQIILANASRHAESHTGLGDAIQLFSPKVTPARSSVPDAVYASLSICSSTCRASGNPNCLVRRSQGDDIVGRTTRGRGGGRRLLRWWRWWVERKPGHISCGNGVITSPITIAITEGGLAWERGLWACRWADMRDKFRNRL